MYLIGIDSSTTATKSLIIDADGEIVAVGAVEYPFETPHPLWSEQHPDLWWDGTVRSLRGGAGPVRHRPGGGRGGGRERPDARAGAAGR